MIKHIHLIPADFETFNLDDIENENNRNKELGVCWSNGYDGGGAQNFNVDDEVYIYFHDSRHLTDRILLKSRVAMSDNDENDSINNNRYLFTEYAIKESKSDDISLEQKKEYESYAKGKHKGFYLTDFCAISTNYENDFKYVHSYEDKNNIGICGVKIYRNKMYLDKYDNQKAIELGKKLRNTPFKRSLSKLIEEYNNHVCEICNDKEEVKRNTFLKPNNLYYYEIHHIFQQNFNSIIGKLKDKEIKEKYPWYDKNKYGENDNNKLIYKEFNEVRLCSKHHNELHYGKYEKRKKILDKLVNKKYKEKLQRLVENKYYEEQILKYIYAQYGLDY